MIYFNEIMENVFVDANKSLVKMTRGSIDAVYSGCQSASLDQVASMSGDEEEIVAGVGMTLMYSPILQMLMVFPKKTRIRTAETIIGQSGIADEVLINSVLQEIGNIFGTALANSLSRIIGEPIKTSPPEVTIDLAGALMAFVVSSIPDVGDDVLLINMELKIQGEPERCGIHLFFEDDLKKKISSLLAGAGLTGA